MKVEKYHEHIQNIRCKLEIIQEISDDLNMVQANVQIIDIANRISGDSFNLLIVGEFSRGKSTFVNALLGRKILPASKNPTTAIISKIVYGEQSDYRIYYQGEEAPHNLTEDEFIKLTAPAEPDQSDAASVQEYVAAQKKLAKVDYAQISYPLSFCQNGVEVVDTPGTNDLNTMRLDITYNYLTHADAVVLLLSATQPLSASEADFLRERILGNQIQDIFFVISRKDELDSEEQEKRVLDFVRENLRKILPAEVSLNQRIFLVSSRSALFYHMQENGEKLTVKQEMEVPDDFAETGFPAFETALGDFLANEKGQVRLRKYQREALAIARKVQHDLAVNLVIAAHSADEIRQKAAVLAGDFQKAKGQVEQIVAEMRLALQNESTAFDYKCQKAGQDILTAAKNAVESLERDMSATAMQQVVERAVVTEKKRFMDAIIRESRQIVDEEAEKAQEKLALIWQDIDVAYQSNFNLPTVVEERRDLVLPESNRSFSQEAFDEAGTLFREMLRTDRSAVDRIVNGVVGVFATAAGVISGLFDMFTGRSQTDWRSQVRTQVIESYRDEGQRLQVAFQQQYGAMVDALCKQIEESVAVRINDMQEQLQSILSEKESQERDAQQRQADLQQKKEELRQLCRELEVPIA